ncbi:MAG: 50S ribosomal protein L30 [Deltaproteobacteria bacterium]|nr:50S ribosomal protein L30 [Deltaproteobacteria bacterium]RLA91487.1 MAG: 50S ribosomal protein L30 [Deltaproteobacteria bacterium]
MSDKLIVTLVRSKIGRPKKQKAVIKGLGLNKLNKKVILKDSPEIWGMIKKVSHLVEVKKVRGENNVKPT